MPSAGDHWSFRMSRQMAPVWLEMLGCHTCTGRGKVVALALHLGC